jgi:hypothetical protein
MARRQIIDTSRFIPLRGSARRYRDLRTGAEVSRRAAIQASTGRTIESMISERAAVRETPMFDRLRNRIENMTQRGFRPDDIAHRTRTTERTAGRVSKIVEISKFERTHELASAQTIRNISRGKKVVSEQRAEQILRALDNPPFDYSASAIGRDGNVAHFELVGEDSVHKFHKYYDAIVKLSQGDSSKFDSLSDNAFNIRIIGPSGRVENYRLNDNKQQIQDALRKGRIEDYELPDRETKRGRS